MANWRPGELNERIEIKRETATLDGLGGHDITLSTLATVWAKVKPIRGREHLYADKLEAPFDTMFVIRNASDLDVQEDDRIEWRGTEYNIRSIHQEGVRPLFLEIMAERGVAQ